MKIGSEVIKFERYKCTNRGIYVVLLLLLVIVFVVRWCL
ncbi:MAG: hypothetical protein Hyperionvirus17_29 [Hyperionvirus sp.]|uniref:Uncharacterized protein n=1 Tax=Hyperionvirus sp. TaxID=2487770 RepID=A0A3G5AFF6_9VIRU|nr:MAG: hypothetical protein Hyperionvirus17_29 [Hyperionvirus sp.]